MAPQKDLAKIGLEGFEMIDEFLGRKRQHTKSHTRTLPQKQETAINCDEMARAYGGVVIKDHFVGKGRGFVMQKRS